MYVTSNRLGLLTKLEVCMNQMIKEIKWMSILHSQSLGILLSPFTCSGLEFRSIALVELGDLWHERVIGVGVGEERGDGEQNFRDGECGRPLVLEDVQADGSVCVDVGMVDLGDEVAFGWPEGIIGGEVDVEEEDASCIWTIFWTDDGCLPVELVVLSWSG